MSKHYALDFGITRIANSTSFERCGITITDIGFCPRSRIDDMLRLRMRTIASVASPLKFGGRKILHVLFCSMVVGIQEGGGGDEIENPRAGSRIFPRYARTSLALRLERLRRSIEQDFVHGAPRRRLSAARPAGGGGKLAEDAVGRALVFGTGRQEQGFLQGKPRE